jgi:signal transduction histidine kinase
LETALKDLCESLISDSTGISFQAYGIEENIPEQTQINIYRIVQEMLANAVRHAQAMQYYTAMQPKRGYLFHHAGRQREGL